VDNQGADLYDLSSWLHLAIFSTRPRSRHVEFDFVALILRWLHILAACAAVGGTLFMRMALLPAAVTTLSDDQHRALREGVRSRWAPVVMAAIAFLLISGLYNLIAYSLKLDLPASYHMLFGVKFILAMIVFFLASALVGRSSAMDRFRQNAKLWQSVNLALLIVIVLISGVLRSIAKDAKPAAPDVAPTSVSANTQEMFFAGRMSSDYAGDIR
jgi:uncharacterized membrane protein